MDLHKAIEIFEIDSPRLSACPALPQSHLDVYKRPLQALRAMRSPAHQVF